MGTLAPNVIRPSTTEYIDADYPITFEWEFQHSNLAESQSAWALKRREDDNGSEEWWDADSETWVSEEHFNESSDEQYTFDSSAWSNGRSYLWSIATKDLDGEAGDYTSEFTLDTAHAPVVSIQEPEEDEVFVSDTNNVIIAWDYSNESEHPQQTYEVKVFHRRDTEKEDFDVEEEEDVPVWQSGEVIDRQRQSVRIDEYLPIAADLKAFVRATSRVGLKSEWDDVNFRVLQTLVVSAPEVIVEQEKDKARNRIIVNNTSAFTGTGDSKVFVERSRDKDTWNKVPNTTEVPLNGSDNVTFYDEVPFVGEKVYYRARVLIDV